MLSKKGNLRIILGGFSMTALALTVICAQLTGVFVSDEANGGSGLSRQDMEAVVGGVTCNDCDNCHLLTIPNVLTCARTSGKCDDTKCVDNVITTYGCKPDQGLGADGCDTKTGTEPMVKHYYNTPEAGKKCVLEPGAGPDYKLWKKIWYGCDTSDKHTCSDREIKKACERIDCPNQTFDKITEQAIQYVCGC